jgi:hypothetical protein
LILKSCHYLRFHQSIRICLYMPFILYSHSFQRSSS